MLAGHLRTGRIAPISSFTLYFYCTSEQICLCLNSEKSNNIIASWKIISIAQLKELEILKLVVIQKYSLHVYLHNNTESRLLFIK